MMESEIIKKKKMIYISTKANPIIENIVADIKEIDIVQRYINEYNLTELLQSELKTLNSLDFFVIDVQSICNSTSDVEIINCIHKIKELNDIRIIFIAQGYQKGNSLLSALFHKGVYNIITANSDLSFEEEFKKAVSEKGISFANAAKYEVETPEVMSTKNQTIVKQNYIKIKQDVTVGVLGVCSHIGTTTCAINILNFFNSLANIKACLIENNEHKDIIKIYERNKNNEEISHFDSIGKVEYNGLDMYYKPELIGDIRKEKYNFYIYDFGNIDELSENDLASFLNKDIKILVMSNSVWEEDKILSAFIRLNIESSEDIYFLFNFVAEDERNSVIELLDNLKDKIYFSEYQPNAFKLSNRAFLEKIFKKFFENFEFQEEKKKVGFFSKLIGR